MKKLSYEKRRIGLGYFFIGPWLIGFVSFLILPLIHSVIMSFNTLGLSAGGTSYEWAGISNYVYALTGDETFVPSLLTTLADLFINVPIILVCSFFFAVLLKQKFRGNTFMKVVFFLPVILGMGVFASYQMELMETQSLTIAASQQESLEVLGKFSDSGLLMFFAEMGVPAELLSYLMAPIERIYSVMGKAGIQTFIFLAGLNSISPSLYESAHVEGASGWGAFWKITFPMVSPMIIVNTLYSIVDSFTAEDNLLLQFVYDMAFRQFKFGLSSAMSWIFFVILSVIIAVVMSIISRRIVYLT